MKSLFVRAALSGLCSLTLLSAGANALAETTVTFADVNSFVDIPQQGHERQQVIESLSQHFAKLAQALPEGQSLQVEVLDLDLAGTIESRFAVFNELRVMRGQVDWPRMQVRFAILQDGKVLKSGEENMSDMTYLDRPNRYHTSEALRYEKRMIDDWFHKTLMPG